LRNRAKHAILCAACRCPERNLWFVKFLAGGFHTFQATAERWSSRLCLSGTLLDSDRVAPLRGPVAGQAARPDDVRAAPPPPPPTHPLDLFRGVLGTQSGVASRGR
jgi:hypothetical protein